MADSPIRRLIDASSLGTPGARRLRESTSKETARRIVARSQQIAAEEALALLGIRLTSMPGLPDDVIVVTSVDPHDPNPGPADGRTVVIRLTPGDGEPTG